MQETKKTTKQKEKEMAERLNVSIQSFTTRRCFFTRQEQRIYNAATSFNNTPISSVIVR